MSAIEERVRVLDVDQELAAGLADGQQERARAAAHAAVRDLAIGAWDATEEYGDRTSWLGLLVLNGFVSRRTSCQQETAIEIIGPRDLLRPWDHDGEYPLASITTEWALLQPTRLALLDDEFVRRIAPWPTLTAAIVARTGLRARWLAVRLIISQLTHVHARVFYLLWHLGERWGTQTAQGTVIGLSLTHAQIAELIGAQRPSVTTALGRLADEHLVARLADGGWRIPSDTPERLDALLSRTRDDA